MAAEPVSDLPLRDSSVTPARAGEPRLVDRASIRASSVSRQAYSILKLAFVFAPVVAGLDKFFNVLVNWEQYLAPVLPGLLGISAQTFMFGVGAIEIIAGIGVALRARVFAYVVSAWLVGIVINLLLMGEYFDIALRDIGLAAGAFALARLASVFERS